MPDTPRIPSILPGVPDDLLTTDLTYHRAVKVTEQSKATFYKLEDDSFPTLTVNDGGATLEDSDTGDRYRWSSTQWILTHLRGIPTPIDYFIEVASGHIPGVIDVTQEARALNVIDTKFQTLWDHIGDKTYFTVDTQLYVSSSEAADTTARIRVEGLDSNYNLVIVQVTLNGQTQVALPSLLFRVREIFVDNGGEVTGDVYLAESTALSGGVPIDPTKVQSKIPLSVFDSGDFASTNMSHNGFFTVPANFDVHLLSIISSTAKNCDIRLDIRKREQNEVWVSLFNGFAYNGPGPITLSNRSRIQEKADIEIRVLSGNPNGEFSAQIQFVLKEK